MPILSAQNSYKRGLAALVDDNPEEATVHFRRAFETERRRRPERPTMRYLSYYGFCLARSRRDLGSAIDACRRAVEGEPRDPDLLLNLGRVYSLAGKYRLARETLDRGLRISPENLALQRERSLVERCIVSGSLRPGPRRWTRRVRAALRIGAAAC